MMLFKSGGPLAMLGSWSLDLLDLYYTDWLEVSVKFYLKGMCVRGSCHAEEELVT